MGLDEFWGSTPPEIRLFCRAADERRKASYRLAAWSAWHTAAFQRKRNFPEWSEVERKIFPAPPKPQTPEQAAAVAYAMVAALGGKDLTKK